MGDLTKVATAPINMSKRKQRRDPIADYVEWSNNRYNPGHYLGGNIPPYLRKSSLSPMGRRLVGVSLAIAAFVALASFVSMLPFGQDFSPLVLVYSGAVAVLTGWASVTMFRSGSRPVPKNPKSGKNSQ